MKRKLQHAQSQFRQIVSRHALEDDAFREALETDPKKALLAFGKEVLDIDKYWDEFTQWLDSADIKVVQETENSVTFVIPHESGVQADLVEELGEEELQDVAGGGYGGSPKIGGCDPSTLSSPFCCG